MRSMFIVVNAINRSILSSYDHCLTAHHAEAQIKGKEDCQDCSDSAIIDQTSI